MLRYAIFRITTTNQRTRTREDDKIVIAFFLELSQNILGGKKLQRGKSKSEPGTSGYDAVIASFL
jgi:hypothetical protein